MSEMVGDCQRVACSPSTHRTAMLAILSAELSLETAIGAVDAAGRRAGLVVDIRAAEV